MLLIKLLNEQAALNNFSYVETKKYSPGIEVKIKVQLHDDETTHRLMPGETAVLNAVFQKSDGTELTVPCTKLFPDDDRSMWQCILSAANTLLVVGSNIRFDLDFNGSATAPPVLTDSTDLRTGMAYQAISKITFDGEC